MCTRPGHNRTTLNSRPTGPGQRASPTPKKEPFSFPAIVLSSTQISSRNFRSNNLGGSFRARLNGSSEAAVTNEARLRDIGQNLEQLNSEGSLRSFITAVKNATRSTLRRIGFDVIRYNPQTTHEAALARLLAVREIDTVLDIGANEGQYATMVRRAGFR